MPGPSTSSRRAAHLAAVLAIGAIAVALAACGTENYIDQDSLESGMLSLAQETADAESVSCPEEVSSDAGTEFECTVTTAKDEVQVVATITSEGDEDVKFEIQTIDGVDLPGAAGAGGTE